MLLSDVEIIERIIAHIDAKSTDQGTEVWQEPTENYSSPEGTDKLTRGVGLVLQKPS